MKNVNFSNVFHGFCIVGACVLLICFIFYRNLPYKLIIKKEVVHVEHIVEKEVIKEVKIENRDVKTVITEKPDGTKVTVIEDKTVTDTQIDTTKDKESDIKIVEKETRIEKKGLPSWRMDLGMSVDPFTMNKTIEGSINHRLFGPFWLGITGNSKGELGFQMGFTF